MIEAGTSDVAGVTLTYGMVGGGQNAFIGDVHRRAIALDSSARLVAGAFSRSYENTLATGRALGVAPERLYRSFEEMAEAEAKRSDPIDFVVVVTPNVAHYAAVKAFLSRGIAAVCDKPLTFEVTEAEELATLARQRRLPFLVTYTYTGYPAVRQAREMVARGDIGEVRFVSAEYAQEWLTTPLEREGQKQAAWRTDPRQAGKSNCVGDIGSHVENLAAYVTGLSIASLCARLDSFVPERSLDDNASILVNYRGGAKGLYWASQVAVGYDNALRLRVFGTKGAIEWAQENPNYLKFSSLGRPSELLSRGRDPFYPRAQAYSRIPAGHPEGYFEAFANLYRAYTAALTRTKSGATLTESDLDFPGGEAGVSGVRFIGKCVESSSKGAAWVQF